MTLEPLLSASPVIQVHAYSAFAAVILGAAQLALPKGDRRHRAFGWIWAALLMSVALSSLFIHTIRTFGPWSPIHLLSLFTLAVTPYAVAQARYGRVAAHQMAMTSIFSLALVVTGLFTFLARPDHEQSAVWSLTKGGADWTETTSLTPQCLRPCGALAFRQRAGGG